MKLTNCIESFDGYMWKREINVRDFIQHNYTPYYGDESFLQGPTAKTKALWDRLSEMFKVERSIPSIFVPLWIRSAVEIKCFRNRLFFWSSIKTFNGEITRETAGVRKLTN